MAVKFKTTQNQFKAVFAVITILYLKFPAVINYNFINSLLIFLLTFLPKDSAKSRAVFPYLKQNRINKYMYVQLTKPAQ